MLINLVVNGLQSTARPHSVKLSADYVDAILADEEMAERDDRVFVGRDKFRNVAPMAAIHVEDDGDGMTPEVLGKIFESYFTTKPTGKGTGLGLAIVQRLVSNAGAGLRVQSSPGNGAKFTIYLPVMVG
ncbi:MAG: sensor histidine kinase [Limisphaerales bacterium]